MGILYMRVVSTGTAVERKQPTPRETRRKKQTLPCSRGHVEQEGVEGSTRPSLRCVSDFDAEEHLHWIAHASVASLPPSLSSVRRSVMRRNVSLAKDGRTHA